MAALMLRKARVHMFLDVLFAVLVGTRWYERVVSFFTLISVVLAFMWLETLLPASWASKAALVNFQLLFHFTFTWMNQMAQVCFKDYWEKRAKRAAWVGLVVWILRAITSPWQSARAFGTFLRNFGRYVAGQVEAQAAAQENWGKWSSVPLPVIAMLSFGPTWCTLLLRPTLT